MPVVSGKVEYTDELFLPDRVPVPYALYPYYVSREFSFGSARRVKHRFCRFFRLRYLIRMAIATTTFLILIFLISQLSSWASKYTSENFFNSTEVRIMLKGLCSDYQNGVLDGDFCNRLCFNDAYQNMTLLDYKQDNKHVVTVLLGGQRIVLKSELWSMEDYEQLSSTLSENDFFDRVLESVNSQLELDWQPAFLSHLIDLLYPSYIRSSSLSLADRRSLWSLLQQSEYTVYAVLKDARIFPRLMGTCGHFYAVEYAVPFKLETYFYGAVRSRVLLHLLGTLKLMHDFLNEPLQWCDVKFEHFGLHPDFPKRFLILDASMIFTRSRMRSVFENMPCNEDKDCAFFDCQAKCDPKTKHCTKRTNDNIEVFCRKLVYQMYGSFWTRANKLLEACHFVDSMNVTERLKNVRQAWSFSLSDLA